MENGLKGSAQNVEQFIRGRNNKLDKYGNCNYHRLWRACRGANSGHNIGQQVNGHTGVLRQMVRREAAAWLCGMVQSVQ